MICLTCKHLFVSDGEEARRFYCGHSDFVDVDGVKASPEITTVAWDDINDVSVVSHGPGWCPREDKPPQSLQKELFQ